MVELSMYRARQKSWDIEVTRNGSLLDVTGKTLRFTAKFDPNDTDAEAVFQKTTDDGIAMTDPGDGLVTLTVDDEDTEDLPYREVTLYWDLQYQDGSNDPITLETGTLQVVPNITRTKSE